MNRFPFLYRPLALVAFACMLVVIGCEEVPPTITPTITDRRVIIEEFTGVRCVNCPAGSAELQNLVDTYGDDKVIPISIHAGFFSPPYSDSNYDFRTPEGDNLEPYIGPLSGFPCAVINRRLFSGEPELPITPASKWNGLLIQELGIAPSCEVELSHTYDSTSRLLTLEVEATFLEDVTDPLAVSVMLTESGLFDKQLTPAGFDLTYEHKYALRDMITAFDGDPITSSTNFGDVVTSSFTYTIPTNWDASKVNIIGFINTKTSDKSILQANWTPLVD